MQILNKRGFTLIELLVVIAIIGILASIMVVSLTNAQKKARDAKRQSELNQLRTAMTLYADDHTALYPAPSGNTCSSSTGTGTSLCPFATSDANNPVKPEYMATPLITVGAATYAYNYTNSAAADAYAAYVQLEAQPTTTYYCIDSTGKAGTTTTSCAGLTVCP